MRPFVAAILSCAALAAVSSLAAQPPGEGRENASNAAGADDLVARMMAFDANKDGKLTRSEVTDQRLRRLFDRADTNKDNIVTQSELNVLMVRERASARGKSGRFGGPGGGPGFGGPGFGPPRPGQILPPILRQRLALTADQEKQVDALQKEVDAKLAQILTAEQRQELKQMQARGPGGPGFGPPPGEFGPPPGEGGPPGGFGPPPGGGRRPGGEEPPPPPEQSL